MNIYWLIDRVLSGNATPEEKKELDEWLSRAENREEYDDLKLLWEFSRDAADKRKSDPNFYDGLYRIREIIELRRNSWRRHDWKFYASILALILSIVALVYCCVSYQARGAKRENVMTLEERPLRDVFAMLQTRYKVTIAVENPQVLTCRFTGTFNSTARLEDILDAIRKSTGVRFTVEDGTRIKIIGECK